MSVPYPHILVTGGAGFIGSHLVRMLLAQPQVARVTNVDKLTYAGNPANLADVAGDPRYHFVHLDIADPRLRAVLRENPPDAIINVAAETHVDRAIADPLAFARTDVLGTQNLLECARDIGVRRYVQVSTDEVYGSIPEGAATEDSPLRPGNPYSASKAGGDLLCLSYVNTYGLSVSVCRGANTYGPHQYPEKFIPLAITNLLTGQPVPLYGDGRQRRDWLYVTDHCAGILMVLERGVAGEVYNIAGGQERENRAVLTRLRELLGAPEEAVLPVADRPGHDRRYAMTSAKLRALGWVPRVTVEDGLADTVAWYQQHPDWWQTIRRSATFTSYYTRQYPMLPPLG
jgi:dTDP-glucose 4,6-dehydratase